MPALEYTNATLAKARMGISDTNSDTILASLGTAVNEWVESYVGAPVGPSGTAARTYDGDGSTVLVIRQGVNAITTLEIANQTGGTFTTIAASGYVLRPHSHDRPTGWPARYVVLTELATSVFTHGFDTVRVTPTGEFGWTAIPPDLKDVAQIIHTRLFKTRQSGELMMAGSTDFNTVVFRTLPEHEHRAVLDRYRGVISQSWFR